MSFFGRKKRQAPRKSEKSFPAASESLKSTEPKESVELEVTSPDLLSDAAAALPVAPDTGEFRALESYDNTADTFTAPIEPVQDTGTLDTLNLTLVPEELTREEKVETALTTWRASLADLASDTDFLTSARSGYHLDLTQAHPQGLAHLFATRGSTRLSMLVREDASLVLARAKAARIRDVALKNAEDRGLTTCHIGIGEASWIDMTGRHIHAPILLRPINLRESGSGREDVELDLDAAVDVNPILLRALRDEGVLIDARALLELTDSHHGFDPQPVLDAFRSLGEPLPGFKVAHSLVVGNVQDASGPMFDDFGSPDNAASESPLIAALAGDEDAQAELLETHTADVPEPVSAPDPDARRIAEALGDKPALAVHTPPGSSNESLVTAFVTEQLAMGKRVLVLSQRASRLASLEKALGNAGLEELLLSLRPDPHAQRDASSSIVLSLAKASSFAPPVSLDEPRELGEARDVLVGHGDAMHRIQDPWKVSAHEAINALADLSRRTPAPATTVRLTPQVAQRVMADRERYRALLMRASTSGALGMKPEDTPWFGSSITSATQADRALELVEELDAHSLPRLAELAHQIAADNDLTEATTFAGVREQVRVLDSMIELFKRVKPSVFGDDIERLIAALADKTYRAEKSITMGFGERRRLKKHALALVNAGTTPEEAKDILEAAVSVRSSWQAVRARESAKPKTPSSLIEASALVGSIQKSFDELAVLLRGSTEGVDFENAPVDQLNARMRELSEDRDILDVLPERTSIIRELEFEGFGALVADLRAREVEGEAVVDELDLAWWVSVLEFIARAEPTLSQYDGTKLSQVAERYRRLDESFMKVGRYRVRGRADALLVDCMKTFPDTSRSAIMELNTPGTMSIKDTAAKYQDIVFRARPLWLVSPFMVPQVIPAGEHFDLVVIADATRLPTAAAIPALARATQAVVIGDPFEFTADSSPDFVERTYLLDDVSSVAPVVRLVRDAHPATGGVRRFVADRASREHPDWGLLSAPPSPTHVDEDSFVYVPGSRGAVKHNEEFVESTEAELQRVSDMVIYHARHTPERSLGIVTLTSTHAKNLLEHVMSAVRALPDVRDFFQVDGEEFFTVVSVEDAGTLVRDDIIVSLGFGLTPHDRLLHRFGPLSLPQGRRALMSALTRARFRTSVVSGIRSTDMDVERLKSSGGRDLRDFLLFAEAGFDPAALRAEPNADEPSDANTGENAPSDAAKSEAESSTAELSEAAPADAEQGAEDQPEHEEPAEVEEVKEAADSSGALIADLADRLAREGYGIALDYGAGIERVELAIAHPDFPKHFLVAVLTDGPRYRETESVRERDRLALERLEGAGWLVERVWSWALFIDPEGEAERVKKSVARALQQYLDELDAKAGRSHSRHRLPKPKIPAGHPLSFYGPDDFDTVVAYICSDGKARMADQLAAEVREFLAFDQRSVLLDVSISAAIRRYQEKVLSEDAQ